jgi:hypothetical protein
VETQPVRWSLALEAIAMEEPSLKNEFWNLKFINIIWVGEFKDIFLLGIFLFI